jgi:hypothetical protein
MIINYKLGDKIFKYFNDDISDEEKSKLNFVLSNNKGDFLNFAFGENFNKYLGLSICNSDNLKIFKIIDEIIVDDISCVETIISPFKIIRKFSSNITENIEPLILKKPGGGEIDYLRGEGSLRYDSNGNLIEEMIGVENQKEIVDSFYLGPSGGMIYEIENFQGSIKIDLDFREQNDFDEWGRDYHIYEENGNIIVEYTKNKNDVEDYKLFLAIKTSNIMYDIKKEWVEKNYSYSKKRNSLSKRYVYRALNIHINDSKKIYFGAAFTKNEALSQIELLEFHQNELESFDENFTKDFLNMIKNKNLPIQEDVFTAYKLSVISLFKFLNKDLLYSTLQGSFAGFPWFSQVWTRDELTALRAFINLDYISYSKEKLFSYLKNINSQTGKLKRLDISGSLDSFDGVLWLAKRFEDFLYKLEENKKLADNLNLGEIRFAYEKLYLAFEKIIESNWDKENELLGINYGDSWMDTIERKFPIDIQMQFLSFISVLSQLAILSDDREKADQLLDFENMFREKVRDTFYRNSMLYDEAYEDRVSSNVFLAYYFYPSLLLKEDWINVIDNSLGHLRTSWGGILSLSNQDSRYKDEYSGEDNKSYHNGDSWFWINNIAAIVMNDIDDKKYRRDINKIVNSSTRDILKMGTLGFSSEVSSGKEQRAEGCLAQLWSSSTFIEMVDKLYK